MNRRELIELVTAAGLTSASAAVLAADPPPAGGHDMMNMAGMHDMHAMHDHAAGGTKYAALAAAAAKCVDTGEACLAHCIAQLISGDTSMKECAGTTQDVISACTALRQLAIRNSPRVAELAAVCGRICRDCEAECKKFPQHQVCRDCGASCAECARECERVAVAK